MQAQKMTALTPSLAEILHQIGVPFELVEIDPAFSDTAAFCEKYHFPLERSANTIIVASKKEPKQYAACVVPATRRLDVNHAVKELMNGAKCSFATAEETQTLTGMMLGGVTVFGLPASLPIWVDEPLMAFDWVILGGGSRSIKIKISPEVFKKIANASILPITISSPEHQNAAG